MAKNGNPNKKSAKRQLYNRVIGFFVSKGLLLAPGVNPLPTIKLDCRDVIWVAEHLEPRVWEVLPAAIIHFPRTFLFKEGLPEDIKIITNSINLLQDIKLVFKGIPYKNFKKWAEFPLKDKRSKPIGKRKVMKTFRLSPDCVNIIREEAKARKLTEVAFLESLVLKVA